MSYSIKEIELNKVCRTCLLSSEDMKSLYATDSGSTHACFAELLMAFTPLKLSVNDGFPTQICCICVSKLNQFHTFRLNCIQSEYIIQNCKSKIIRTEEGNDFEEVLIKKELPIHSDNINACASATTKSLQDPLTTAETQKDLSQELDLIKHELIDIKIENGHNINIKSNCLPVKLSEIETTTLNSTNRKLYSCTECDSSFRDKAHLISHRRKHTGENPYPCTVCNNSFARKHHLIYHMRTHTGEKPYACTICSSSFNQKGTLTNHLRTHSGEKPYSCTFCNKCFGKTQLLKLHLRTHTGEKPYSCRICNISFGRNQHLKNHMLTHTGEKLYACTVCEHSFTLKGALTVHMRKHTSENTIQTLN